MYKLHPHDTYKEFIITFIKIVVSIAMTDLLSNIKCLLLIKRVSATLILRKPKKIFTCKKSQQVEMTCHFLFGIFG